MLVPAREEGERALRVLRSLLDQDYAGTLEIYIVLKDVLDSSAIWLSRAWPESEFARVCEKTNAAGAVYELARERRPGGDRCVYVAAAGVDAKSQKINRIVADLSPKYTAIIDCDHQAHAGWIRSSIDLLRARNASFVQGRRGALSARGFFRLWDSLHQHVGCELFNATFSRMGLTVFFTGTTAVLETRLLRENPLRASITEDADLSYQLVLEGEKIVHNPECGSDEELSPNLYSFLARRRRWANGHTGAFFRHLPRLRRAPLSVWSKLQFLYHGLHYLVAGLVALLQLLIGLYFLPAMSAVHIFAAAAAALYLSRRLSASQKSKTFLNRCAEVGVLLLWFFPALIIAFNLVVAILAQDLPRAVLPLPTALQLAGVIAFASPLVLLVAGLARFGQLNVGAFVAVVASYPVAFYLDLAGVLIGFADLLTGWSPWHAITRSRGPVVSSANASQNPAGPTRAFALDEAIGIQKSWSLRGLGRALGSALRRSEGGVRRAIESEAEQSRLLQEAPTAQKNTRKHTTGRTLMRYSGWISFGALLLLVPGALAFTPRASIEHAGNSCAVREHDTDPWIVAPEKIPGYCEESYAERPQAPAGGFGSFALAREDDFEKIDSEYWDRMDSTFFCNLARFRPENVRLASGGDLRFSLEAGDFGDRRFASGSIATKDHPDASHLYGRFEVVLKPARVSGVVTAFFLYRFDPWQEIDAEFLGNDTTKLLVNVFYNPGAAGDKYNYGYRGTPVVIDLGFDAADDFHRYAIEWDPDEIRWFVDDRLVHSRSAGRPTPIPHLPMRFHLNAWPTCSEELAGPFDAAALPAEARFRSVNIYEYRPAAFPRYSRWLDRAFDFRRKDTSQDWRNKAEWLQPRS